MKLSKLPWLWLFTGMLVLACMQQSSAQTEPKGQGANASRPVVKPPANARPIDNSHVEFATYPLITARIAQRGGIDGNISATRTVEGPLDRTTYRLPGSHSAGEVAAGYERRLGTAGFDVLFKCEGKGCGPTFVRASPGYRVDADLFGVPLAGQHYIAARRGGGAGDVYTGIQIAPSGDGLAIQVDTLRVKPREVSAISVNAAQMSQQLDTRGRIALYGIYFGTDSADIKSESTATLDEIGKLMQQRPTLRLLVVGHTDNRGSFDYNIELSKRRARSVVAALVNDQGIDRDRLKPWGVGYTVPRVSNSSSVGQAKNRRVELVVW